MKRITFLLLSFFLLSTLHAQEHCMTNAWHRSTELFPGNVGELNGQDYLIIYSDSIEFDGAKYKIKESITSPFESKDDLLRYFSCYYDFFNDSENISGELIKYQFDVEIPRVGDALQYIHFNDCGRFEQFVYVDDGLYHFSNTPIFQMTDVIKVERTEIEEVIVEYTYDVDTNALVYYVEEPEFEIVTEQNLVRNAYTSIEEVPGEYGEGFLMIYNEFSSCEGVAYDTVYGQVLVKDGGVRYDVTPAVFETVSEQIGVQSEFEGEIFYERERQDSLSIIVRGSYYELKDVDLFSGCNDFEFLSCANIGLDLIPIKDTIIYNVYESCPNGFKTAGKYCYNDSGTVPWVYEIRTYEVLTEPATSKTILIPNEYTTVMLLRVANKDELGSDCVEIIKDSIAFETLLTPYTIKETNVPAIYETREYKKYEDSGKIEVVEGGEDSYAQILTLHGGSFEYVESKGQVIRVNRSCYLDAIAEKMIEVGYLDENEKENIEAFQLAVLKYQVDHILPIGVIDVELINALDVKFGF